MPDVLISRKRTSILGTGTVEQDVHLECEMLWFESRPGHIVTKTLVP